MNRRHGLQGLLALAALVLAPAPAIAQSPPATVKLIVGYAAGGPVDQGARMIAPYLARELGTTVVVENKPGANGTTAGDTVAKSAGDGVNLWFAASPPVTISPNVMPKMPFDPGKDLVPVAALARLNLFLVTRGDFPAADVREFLAYLKKNPGKVTYGSAGNATGLHLAGEMLKSQAGVFAVHVPYRGASLALQDLLAGQIDFYFDPGIALGHVKAGKLKMLAIGAPQRSSLYPEVPTLHEAGLKGFDAGTTHGLYAPDGTPPAVVERLNREINAILATPAVKAQIATLAAEPSPMTPAQFAAVMREDSKRYGAVIRERRITAS